MRVFKGEGGSDSDVIFLHWMATNPEGYVVNTGREMNSKKAVLHLSGCGHISGFTLHKGAGLSQENHHTGKGFIKVCSVFPDELLAWCRENRQLIEKGFSAICRDCLSNATIQSFEAQTPIASDINKPPPRVLFSTYRILRDTAIARLVKRIYADKCQICGYVIELENGLTYSEAHHIQPLGKNGPDIAENILCVCPNHHVLLDYYAIGLDMSTLRMSASHSIGVEYLDHHNNEFKRLVAKKMR